MPHPGSHSLSSLLALLNNKEPGSPITSVVNATTIDLIYNLLSMDPKDYVKIAEQLSSTSDVNNMLDFILCLVCNGHLSNTSSNANGRARRLMIKVITKTPVIPTSLIVTGVSMPAERDYIGGGGFGHVYRGELGGTAVALKVLYKANNNVAFCREALMWGSLKHKFVLPFLGIYEFESGTVPQFFLVSPYMKNGTLAQWRKEANPSIARIAASMMEVAQGIEYIHSESAVHGDLRGDNIFLDANFHIQIADFGLTRLSDATATRSGALHLSFAAPELFDCADDDDDTAVRTKKSDVYAFGCLYYEIHYNIMPFAGKTDMQILKLISQGARPPQRDEPPLYDKAWELIQRCWAQEALERPGMKDIAEWMMAIVDLSPFPSWERGFPDSAPTYPRSPSLLPMIGRRPSQIGIEDLSARIPTESLLVSPQPSNEVSSFLTNGYYNVPDKPSLRAAKQPQLQRRPKKPNEEYIKRPENAFILFRRRYLEDRLQDTASDSPIKQRQADLAKTISQQWKSLSSEERESWEQLAMKKRKEHEQMYPNYIYRPQRPKDKTAR